MPYQWNPYTRKLDIAGGLAAGGVFTGGTDTYVMFNDAGTVGQSSSFTFNKATGDFGVPNPTFLQANLVHPTRPFLYMAASTLGANLKAWNQYILDGDTAGTLRFSAITDDGLTNSDWLRITRTLAVPQLASFLTPLSITGLAGQSAITIAGVSQTVSKPLIDAAQTWNAVGIAFTGLKAAITGTAFATLSKILDLQIGGNTTFAVGLIGASATTAPSLWLLPPAAITANNYLVQSTAGAIFINTATSSDAFEYSFGNGAVKLFFDATSFRFASAVVQSWTSGSATGTRDTGLSRISAGLLGLGNSTAADFSGGLKLTNLTVNRAATFLSTSLALTDGAGAGAGTILNAPAAGNPTKWIGIDDNGTTRYIPAW